MNLNFKLVAFEWVKYNVGWWTINRIPQKLMHEHTQKMNNSEERAKFPWTALTVSFSVFSRFIFSNLTNAKRNIPLVQIQIAHQNIMCKVLELFSSIYLLHYFYCSVGFCCCCCSCCVVECDGFQFFILHFHCSLGICTRLLLLA